MKTRISICLSRTCLGLFFSLTLAPAALPADSLEDGELEAVIVTGSRIARPEGNTPNPIVSYEAQNIEQSGHTNLVDLLTQSPALVHSTTSYDSAGNQVIRAGDAGLNLLNLRNLGVDRTLVLVNGRRHVAGVAGSAAVDINTMPLDLIERVDVLTGGVSAIYGADGVSGVVNFVTKRNFDGVSIRGQGGISGHGDAGNRHFSITAGHNFADGRGNIAASYQYDADDKVSRMDRGSTGNPLRALRMTRNPDDVPDDPAIYDQIPLGDVRYANTARGGAFDTDFDFLPDFTGTGGIYDLGTHLPESGGFVQGGSSTPVAGYLGDLQPRIRRHSFNLLGSHELGSRLRLFAEGKYVLADTDTFGQPSYDPLTFINADNPFIPAAIRGAIVPGAASDAFGVPLPDGLLMFRDNFDLGRRGESVERATVRTVAGVDGQVTDNTRFELSYTFGQTRTRFDLPNYRVRDRYFAALDAVDEGLYLNGVASGHIVCRVDVDPPGSAIDPINYGSPAASFTPGTASGCVPLNLFGEDNVSADALAFINADNRSRARLTQHVVSGSMTGDSSAFFELPGGPAGFAVGAEYRKEKSRTVPDQLIQDGLLQDLVQIAPERGAFDVKEAFVEVNLPVLRNAPLAHALEFGAAVRLSDYSTVGNTTTWRIDGRYAPVRDIMFRGTYSQAVRAPNINELFAPASGGATVIDDPCDPVRIADGSQFRAANCAALLTDFGIDPDDFDPEMAGSTTGQSTGNPLLSEEKARTWTFGVVLRPAALPDLSVSVDWYDIKLKNAINMAGASEFAALCVDQPSLDNTYCDAIGRDATTGYINDWHVSPQNVAKFSTAGADLVLDYDFKPAAVGDFHLRVVGGYLDKLAFISTPGADPDSNRGETGAPKFLATADLTWTRDAFSANYGINWFSRTRRFTTEQLAANPDLSDPAYFFYKARWEHDIRLAYALRDRKLTLHAGVNNLFDAQPDVGMASYPVSFVGRFFYGGVSLKL